MVADVHARIFDINDVIDHMDTDELGLDCSDEHFSEGDDGDCPVELKPVTHRYVPSQRGVNELGMDFSNKWGGGDYGYGYDE